MQGVKVNQRFLLVLIFDPEYGGNIFELSVNIQWTA
jgi:hypothetical protein